MEKNALENERLLALIDQATAGDKQALEAIILSTQDLVFNLSLRMLGTFADAEDAAQDILLKIITHLSSFKKESLFSTWVFRIAANHLMNCKKHLFAQRPLSFELYGEDILNEAAENVPDLVQDIEKSILAEELKWSCANVMLQCLDMESRCIFVLGTMFQIDSRIAGEILGITPEAYRQRLSRARRKMADFLTEYCGEFGSGKCRCSNRVNYAVQTRRLNPASLDFTSASEGSREKMIRFQNAMEDIDGLASHFTFCKEYESPERTKRFFQEFLKSASLSTVKNT